MSKDFEITGINEVINILKNKSAKDVKNLSRATVNGVSQEATKEVRKNASTFRDTGTLVRGIKNKRLKGSPARPAAAVTITKEKGPKSAYYWRFQEHGTSTGIQPKHFVRDAKNTIERNLPHLANESFKKVLIRRIKRELKKIKN